MSHYFDHMEADGKGRSLDQELEQFLAQRSEAGFYDAVDVAIVCESTYPYLTGGLSAVVHQICVAHPAPAHRHRAHHMGLVVADDAPV